MSADSSGKILVGVVMGSRNDYGVMRSAVEMLTEFGVAHEVRVVSAHRTPDLLFEYAETAVERGLRVIIAAAGGAAHLPWVLAARSVVPGLGVPSAAAAQRGAGISSRCSCLTGRGRRGLSSMDAGRRSGTIRGRRRIWRADAMWWRWRSSRSARRAWRQGPALCRCGRAGRCWR